MRVRDQLLPVTARLLLPGGRIGARDAPHRLRYRGLETLIAYLRARRDVLYAHFLREWEQLEQDDYEAELRAALAVTVNVDVTDRSQDG